MIATIILTGFLFVVLVSADGDSGWLTPASLNLQKQAELSAVPQSINGNVDCFPEPNAVCAVNTLYGAANTAGTVRLNGSADYHPVISYIDNRQHFIAIPNSSTAISYTTEPVYGFYLYFNYNFPSSIKLTNNGLGPYYQINRPQDAKLVDRTNHRLAADYTSISFSENGQWMVVSEPNIAMLRVNLQTFEVVPFAPGFNYTIGLNPAPQTAITNDGRYAVVASRDFNRFSIYDLSSCATVPDTISGPVNCQSRDLQSYVQAQISNFSGVSNIRFISDDTLGLYASYTENSIHKTAKYILSTNSGIIHQQDYIGLGDSYISGEGAFQYLPSTDTADNHCHVSLVSYPLLLGHQLNYNSYHSVACSGATTNDIINTSDNYRGQAKPRADREELDKAGQVPSILTNFLPGYIDQLDFVKQYQPKAITISIGGNDIGMISKLKSCIKPGTCFSSYEDRLEFVQEVNRNFPKLVNTYTEIKNAGPPDMRVYIIGYPQIAKPGGDCALNVHLDNDEVLFTTQAIDYLDLVVKAAAAKAGVFYTDTEDAFYGHRLCEADPGSVAMNGVTAGNDIPTRLGGPIGSESYHPNDFGHLLMENKILAATDNLTSPMPAPNLSSGLPAQTNLDILNAPHSGRAIKITEFDPNLAADLTYQNAPIDITINGADYSLPAGAALQAELHSTPVSLGSYTTDALGNLSATITIPPTVPASFHTLHFYGSDINGQAIDIYKDVYLAGTADDLDGNGVADSSQKCVGVDASNQDFDQDGVDDACDAKIDLPPATQNTPLSQSDDQPVSPGANMTSESQLELTQSNVTSQTTNKPAGLKVQTAESLPSPIIIASTQSGPNQPTAVLGTSAQNLTPMAAKAGQSNEAGNTYILPALAAALLAPFGYLFKRWLL